ncbi:YDG domain-containing protein [Luteibacter sp. ME-Dv--P-043b]|uniref:YDG domain-containing protein n=1 Tax=Luteibacter sp. ME-Dv--P-043b TaxID=3040291 RepID=UPI002557995A|nr:YDG domain-containing protein [Luteibacter sp. ME-Dv--P-043b]
MNRIYRLCWNVATSQWVAASELARGSRPAVPGTTTRTIGPRASSIALAIALALGAGVAHAGQTGGQVAAGTGVIHQDGAVTTVNQTSQRLSLNWQSFDIGANETVNFVQPGRDAIAVNRILGNKASDIYGHLNANGQVWLINPNGVLFGEGAQVNVGGLVASTLDTSDDAPGTSLRRFSGDGKGSIVNKGSLRAASGGYIALLGNTVSNQGTVSAQLGTVAMGGGSAVTLTFDGSRLMHLQVDRSTLDNLVENRQLVQADGGRVFMTAGAADSLLASTVNNTGVVRAQTVENRHGQIVLLGGMAAGHVEVAGTLDASAPHGGDGGSIETSGAFAHIGAATITAAAPKGTAGAWLVDPYDLTIDSTAAGTIASTLNGGTSVTEQTTATGASGAGVQNASGAGDITVNAPISWNNASATLTLDAYRAVNVNSAITGAGTVVIKANGNGGNGNITLGSSGTIAGGAGVTLTAANNFVNNAGSAALSSASGTWRVYSASPSTDTRGGLTPQFIQYNATPGTTVQGAGNGFLYALAPTVAITGLTGTVEKTYDGTTSASLADANFSKTGLVDGNTMAVVSGTYAGKDAASGIQVTAPSATSAYTFTDATGAVPVYGYTVTGTGQTAAIGVIDPRQLGIAIVNNPTKTYNGTRTATLVAGNYQTSGLVSGEGISFSQPNSVAYDAASAGATNVTANFVASNFVAANGTKLSNYVLPSVATGMGTINKAKVQLSGLIGTDKTYDGSTADTLDISHATIFGVISGDTADATLDTAAGSGAFADANVGNGKAVGAIGFRLAGNKASNYDLVLPTDITAAITPRTLTIQGVSATGKAYDATTSAALALANPQLMNLVAADQGAISLVTTGATGNFATKNVGTGIAVAASGFSLAGNSLGNYTLTQPAGLTADITPRRLDLSIVNNPTRTYNGTTTANLAESNVQVAGLQGGETASVKQASSASYDSANAGARTVTAWLEGSDFTLGNGASLSNYTFDSTVVGAGSIAQAPLTWTIVGNPAKQYDGTTAATLDTNNYRVYGFIAGEGATVTQTAGTYSDKDVGTRGVTATVGSGDFAATGGTLLSNYVLPTSISGYGTITPRDLGALSVVISGHPTRAYDGTTVATLIAGSANSSGDYTLTVNDSSKAFAPGEGVYITKTTGTYASKNVGKQPVSVSLADSDYTPYGGTSLSNYTPLPTSAYGTGEITPAQLTAAIINTPTKVYNGTTYMSLAATDYAISGFANNEGAQIVPSKLVAFDTKNVGTGKTITAQMATTSYLANAGTDLSNYTLDFTAEGPGSITAAPLYILGVSAQNKTYDTTAAATLNSAGASLLGLVSTDTDTGKVTLAKGTTGTFATGDAGTGIAVTPSGFSISGSEAGNYALQPLTGLTATISPYTLSISGVSAVNKVYDATTAIGLDTSNAALHGVFASDAGNVALDTSSAGGSVRSANAISGQAVTVSGLGLSGSRSANYRVDQVGGLTADIAKRTVTASITGNPTKPYDGSNSVTLLASDYTLNGFVGMQSATIPQSSTANYLDVNAGSNVGLSSTLSVSDFVAGSNTNLANYSLPTAASGTRGTITPFIVNLMGTRVYNATVHADASLFTSGGTVAGVNGETLTLTGSGNLVTKNVGAQRAFADFGTLALGGNGGSTASNYTLAGGIDWVTITPAALTVINTTAADKVYDGNTLAQLSGAQLAGVLGSDTVSLDGATTATGTFASKNVGTRNVTTAMQVTGSDAANYVVIQPTGISAAITLKSITATATAQNKQYDGGTAATTALASSGVVAGDSVTFGSSSSTFDGKDVANGRTVTVSGITAGGGDAGNYTLGNTSATTTADITPRVLTLTGSRVYDAGTTAAAGTLALGNLVAGESLVLGGAGALNSKNVGVYRNGAGFDNSGLTLADNAGLASNYTLAGGVDRYTVSKAALTVSGTTATSKIYDGNRNAALQGSHLDGVLGSDDVSMTNTGLGTFDTKNVGTNKAVTTAIGLAGGDMGNYTVSQPTTVRADITAKAIAVAATGVTKVYDGTTASAATLYSNDLAANDNVSFSAGTNVFDSKDAGTGKTVSLTGIVANGSDAANYTLSNTSTTTAANITPFVIGLTGTRVYDSTTTAAASLFGSSGVVTGANGETLTLSGSGVTHAKNVGTYNLAANGTGTLSLGTLALTGNGGASAGNYTLTGGVDRLTITPYALTVAATGVDKVYDASLNATVTLASGGVFGGDTVNFAYGTALFGDKNASVGKTVSVGGISASGTDAANYTVNTTATTTATITPKAIAGSIVADSRTYDTTTNATTHGSLAGVIAGDSLSYASTTGSFLDKAAGTGKTVDVSGVLTGADRNNYVVTANTTTTASIAKAAIVVGTTASNKVYDGTSGAVTSLGKSGVLGSDVVDFTSTGASFSDANAANGKTVTTGGIAGSGADAGNYTWNATSTTTANITPLVINLVGSRVYDGSNAIAAGVLSFQGMVFGLNGDALALSGTGAVADKNVGNTRPLTSLGTLALAGTGGSIATNYTLVGGTHTASITPKAITGSIVADGRTYDTTALATTHGSLSGVVAGDDLRYTSTSGSFADKNAGTGKTVTVSGVLGGGDLGNYTIASNATTTASIARAAIQVNTIAADKVYDGADTATTVLAPAGVLGGDVVTFSSTGARFSDANATTGKTVTTSGIAASGADAANYLWNAASTTTASITPYVISLQGTRIYDGSTTVAADSFGPGAQVAGINGDTLTLSGIGAVGDKNVGTQKAVTSLGTLGLQGNGSALAGNYTLLGGTHTATITPKQIVVDATGSTKVYDANTLATAALSSTGIVSGDQVAFSATSTRYDTKNVGNGKAVTVDGIAASGTDAGNYAINTATVTTGDITPLAITGTIAADGKTYDGGTAAQTHGTFGGTLAGDDLGLVTQGQFVDKNAGNGKRVDVGAQLTGADAGNYALTANTTTMADIRKVVLDLSGNRVYDGTAGAGAGMFGERGVLDGIAGESLTLSGSGVLASRNVATDRPLASLGTLALTGNGATLADNYTLAGGRDVATVTPLGITAAVTTDDKVYDGNASAITRGSLGGVVAGDDVRLSTLGQFVDKNAANGKSVTVAGRIDGGDAGNYVLSFNPLTTASIVKRSVTVAAQGTDKFFDGSRNDTVRLSADGILPGDQVGFAAGSATFADPTVGLGKSVQVSDIAASGADGGNYAFNTTTQTQASVHQNASQGASATALTQIDAVLNPESIATPYGVASNVTVGQYSGNHKKTRQPVEKNVQRADFTPGLSLQVVEGGVRLPADAMH